MHNMLNMCTISLVVTSSVCAIITCLAEVYLKIGVPKKLSKQVKSSQFDRI